MKAWCPTCWEEVIVNMAGECSWCDTSLAHRPEPPAHVGTGRAAPRPYARMPRGMTEGQLDECYRLYCDEGLSLRKIASRMWRSTAYASPGSMANSLSDLFRSRGWLVRDRIVATIAASAKHGLMRSGARDEEYVRRQRIARGEIRGVTCKAIKTRPGKGQGEQCQRPAGRDNEYCRYHDPARQAEQAAQMAALRARRRPAPVPANGSSSGPATRGEPAYFSRQRVPGA